MPQTTSWNIGVGVTCFIGAVGGMYLAFRGYKYIRKVKELKHSQNKNEFCPICNTKIDSLVDKNWISCINCDQIVCRKPKCAKWIASRGQEWECQLCHDQRRAHFKASEWLLTQLSKKLQISSALDLDDISVLDYNKQVIELNESDVNGTISDSQKEYIRAFLEDLLSTLLGGSLDNVLVGPIRKSSDYLPICDHECPGLAQAKLKRLIQKIIAEAARLPELLNMSGVPPRPEEHLPYFDPKKYNQLLATAVLNKVVESYHNPRNPLINKEEFEKLNVDFNQNTVKPEKDVQKQNEIAPIPSETPKTSAMKIESPGELEAPAGVSSATSQSVYSDDDSESSEQLLETLIKQQEKKTKPRLPDLTSDDTNDDEYHSIKSVATDSTWEDNWMFKTKRNTNDGSNSIAMLIPSPTEEVKVLIGDRTADEISDLSDNHDSDNDDEYSNSSDSLSDSDEPKSPADIPNVLVHNKTVIGGKHPLTDFIENSSDFESLTSQNSFSEAKNDLLIEDGDYVKVDKPLLDIEYSTLDMKNGNVEKMKEAINPFVERKVDADSDAVVKNKGDECVKVEKNVVSGVPSEIQTTKEIIVDSPTPAQRKSSKGDISAPNNASPKPDDAFGNICHSKIKIHPTAIHKRKLIVTNSPDEDYSVDLLPIIDIGTQIDDHETNLHAIYISSPPPLLLLPIQPHHDDIATKIINISDHDDDDDEDDDDDDDDHEDNGDDDDVDVNDSDFDLISVNSSEFSFHKPRNLNSNEETGLKSPIEKSKTSFDVSNEEICKEILEMVAKQPLDIVVSTIPAVKEETKITINQTVWQPRMMPKVDKATWASENTSSADVDENLVEVIKDVNESKDESSKSVDSLVEAVSPFESKENIATIEIKPSVMIQNTNDSLEESTVEAVKKDHVKEDKCEKTDINDQLSKIAEMSREIETTLSRIINENQHEPLVDETATNTISAHVIVKEYIPEESAILDDNNVKELNPTNENILENILMSDNEIIATPAATDANVTEEVRKIEDILILNPQKSEPTELKKESDGITELIQKLEIISLSENVKIVAKADQKIDEPFIKLADPATQNNTIDVKTVLDIKIQIPELKESPAAVSTPNEIIKLEEKMEAQLPNNINKSDERISENQNKTEEEHKIETHIPTIEITPNTPVSINVPEMTHKQNENLNDVKNLQSLSVEFATKPAIEIYIGIGDCKEREPEITCTEPLSVSVSEEIRKIEEKLEDLESETLQPTLVVEPVLVGNELSEPVVDSEIPAIKIQILDADIINPEIAAGIQTNERPPVIVIEDIQKVVRPLQATPIGIAIDIQQLPNSLETSNLTNDLNKPLVESTDEVRKIEEISEPIAVEISTNIDLEEPEIDHALEPQIQTTDLNEQGVSNTPVEIQDEPAVKFHIQTMDLKEIVLSEPVSITVTEEVRKIEKKLEEANNEITPPVDDVRPNEERQIERQEEQVKTESYEVTIIVNSSQIIEEKTEESVIEPQIQTTDIKEIITSEPVYVIVTEEVRKIEEKLGEAQIEESIPLPIEIKPKIQTTDLNVDKEVVPTEQISVIATEMVREFETNVEEVKTEIQEVPVIVNASQIIEEKLEESVIEQQIQTTDTKEIITSKPISVIVTEEVRKIEEKLGEDQSEESIPLPIKIETKIQTTHLKVDEEVVPNEQISVIATDVVREFNTKVEEVRKEIQEVPVAVNDSQIIEEKLEESVVEPQIQTTDIKEIITGEPISVIVTEEVRKIEEKLEEAQNEESIPLPIKIEPKIQTTNLKVDEEVVPTEQISVIATEVVREFQTKTEEVKTEIQEVPVAVNDSQIIEGKLEESVIEQQIQTTDMKEIITGEPISVIVTEEVRKIEEKLGEGQIEELIPLPIKIETKIQTTDLKVDEEVVPNEQISVTTTEVIREFKTNVEEVRTEIQEVPVAVNDSQIIEEKLEESVVEQQIQTTDIKEIITSEPISVLVTEEVRKIEEKLEEAQNEEPIPLPIKIEPKIQTTNLKVDEEVVPTEQISESVIEPQIQIPDKDEIESYESEYVIVTNEGRKIEQKLGVAQNEEPIPIPIKIEPKIPNTGLKIHEEFTPNEQVSVSINYENKQFDTKVEEVKKEIQEVIVTVKTSQIYEEKLETSIIEPQTTEFQEADVSVTELTLPTITLESVPHIKLVEFQSFPISKFPSQSAVIGSSEPLQLTIKSEIVPKQLSPPIDTGFEIISESEIKAIPIEIESTMRSSKLVAGVTSTKITTVSLSLEPISTVIEEPLTPPKSEAAESNSLELNLETILQKPRGSRYSSPLFKPLLPTSPPPPVVKLTLVESPKPNTNNTNTNTSSIIVDNTTTTIIKTTNDEDEVNSVEAPFPGSIAEREHKKWENAVPIANNPYSVEILERRLSQKSNDSQTFQSKHPVENGKPVTQEKLLVDVFKAEVPTIKRFGRDYYINEAKKASGERLRRSELLNQQLHNDSTSSDDHASDSEYQKYQYIPAATEEFVENEQQSVEYPIQKSKSSGDTNRLLTENIFAARPIMVEEDDPLLERAHRVEALSTDGRDFFLLPIQEAQMNIGFSSSEASSLRSPSSLSEDSDTARIYNLRSQEIKKVKDPEAEIYISTELEAKIIPKSPTVLKTSPSFVPVTLPPPAKLSIATKMMSKSVPMFDTSPELNQTNKREIADDINNNIAIEEELKHLLPSVKNLAKAFTETKNKPVPGPINKPKTPWHSSSNLTKPVENEITPPKSQPVKIAEPFIRPGYSISGRSISKQFKDELREITPKSVDSNNNYNNSKVQSNTKVESPPRSPSPTPTPGALQNTLAFFENLNK